MEPRFKFEILRAIPTKKTKSIQIMIPRKTRFGFLRQLSSISKSNHSPLITIDNATIYPLGETVNPYFKDITWRIHEHETWAIVGPSSSGRRVLLEVNDQSLASIVDI
jgi:ABC-type molybdenum transport system ATPase subunit/photorepair protein PhrA